LHRLLTSRFSKILLRKYDRIVL